MQSTNCVIHSLIDDWIPMLALDCIQPNTSYSRFSSFGIRWKDNELSTQPLVHSTSADDTIIKYSNYFKEYR